MTPGATYLIRSGVRRAKAFQLGGLTAIRAEIFDSSTGKKLAVAELPIQELRSPKDVIDLTSAPSERIRFERIERTVRSGRQDRIPPIEVEPGAIGVRIEDVVVIR